MSSSLSSVVVEFYFELLYEKKEKTHRTSRLVIVIIMQSCLDAIFREKLFSLVCLLCASLVDGRAKSQRRLSSS